MSLSLSHGKTLDPGEAGRCDDDLPPLQDTPAASRFDLRTWWPPQRRDLPLELEIGSGKGTFLVQEAARRPDINFLGIEYARAYWLYAADRARRHHLSSLRLLHYDAKVLVTWYAPDQVFSQVHIYFPDPWPKSRHHKRRLIQVDFLSELHRVLAPQGRVHVVTDHDGYFQWIEQQVALAGESFLRQPFEPTPGAEGEMVGTNFERKYRREGRPFHALSLRRR
ncbi:MAG: tRNA (guanosine(46)-N7)-methyltransferase TrmB [Phycisphaerae bacterium]|nr:tRNA (guanosine(46)-N7)-methyltransferase TrmB [Phycisphaerae bacterium]